MEWLTVPSGPVQSVGGVTPVISSLDSCAPVTFWLNRLQHICKNVSYSLTGATARVFSSEPSSSRLRELGTSENWSWFKKMQGWDSFAPRLQSQQLQRPSILAHIIHHRDQNDLSDLSSCAAMWLWKCSESKFKRNGGFSDTPDLELMTQAEVC